MSKKFLNLAITEISDCRKCIRKIIDKKYQIRNETETMDFSSTLQEVESASKDKIFQLLLSSEFYCKMLLGESEDELKAFIEVNIIDFTKCVERIFQRISTSQKKFWKLLQVHVLK